MEAGERSILISDSASYHSALAQHSPLLILDSPSQNTKEEGQRSLHLPLFGSVDLYEEGSPIQSGVAVHVGGPVWALDWCPEHQEGGAVEDTRPQFLAVGVHPPGVHNIPSGKAFHGKGTVQIWRVEERPSAAKTAGGRKGKQKVQPGGSVKEAVPGKSAEDLAMEAVLPQSASLALSIAHEGSLVWDLKWQPPTTAEGGGRDEAAIGRLAAALGNGSVHVWTVPSPATVIANDKPTEAAGGAKKRKRKGEPTKPPPSATPVVVCLPSAVFRTGHASSGRRLPLTLEWSPCAPSNLLLAGCHDGTVVLWRVPDSDSSSSDHVFPLACFKAEETPLRTLAWVPPDMGGGNTLFATGGHRGTVKFWDVRDPLQPIWTLSVSQSWILRIEWLSSPRCLAVSRDDGWYQVYPLDGLAVTLPGCLPPTSGLAHAHIRKLSDGALWGANISRLTGLVATSSSSGVVSFFQLTRAWVAGLHSSNRHVQPAYRCGALDAQDERGPVRLRLSGPQDTFPTRKDANRALLEDAPKHRLEPPEAPGPSKLALEDLVMLEKGNGSARNGGHWRKRPAQVIGADRASDPGASGDNGAGDGRDDGSPFPPRTVSVQRVAWNTNKRYGLWLAWGGRAGVVCCQRVRLPQYEIRDDWT